MVCSLMDELLAGSAGIDAVLLVYGRAVGKVRGCQTGNGQASNFGTQGLDAGPDLFVRRDDMVDSSMPLSRR